MNTKLIGLALFGLTAAAVTAYPALTQTRQAQVEGQHPTIVLPNPDQRPVVEAVFVLDTTGSMGGLIQAAKDKVWSIASTLAAAQPAPQVRMGLVAYRDRGDDYVTKIIDLSSDLDQIQTALFQFQAQGGGDAPESVNQALHEAVTRIGWSRDPAVYRVVFLVGDAPPHQDYPNDIPYAQTLAEAGRRGIRVNTIQCGQQADTRGDWQRIAQLGNGGYFQVDQAGGAVAIATPYDAPLAKLSAELDDTRLYFGNADERSKRKGEVDAAKAVQAASAPAVLARRAEFVGSESGASSLLGDQELVEAVTSGRVNLKELQPEQLPQPLAELDGDARAGMVKATAQRRDALRAEIHDISTKRAGYLKQQVDAVGGAEDSLDHQVWNLVRQQGADAGLNYGTGGPKY